MPLSGYRGVHCTVSADRHGAGHEQSFSGANVSTSVMICIVFGGVLHFTHSVLLWYRPLFCLFVCNSVSLLKFGDRETKCGTRDC